MLLYHCGESIWFDLLFNLTGIDWAVSPLWSPSLSSVIDSFTLGIHHLHSWSDFFLANIPITHGHSLYLCQTVQGNSVGLFIALSSFAFSQISGIICSCTSFQILLEGPDFWNTNIKKDSLFLLLTCHHFLETLSSEPLFLPKSRKKSYEWKHLNGHSKKH